jgi:hypothetical protein
VQATIPREANLEYQHPTAQPIWTAQVNGQPSMAQVWSEADRCCYPIDNVSFSGHISGEVCLDANAPIVLHGAFSGDCGFWGTDSSIYFDERATIHQLDWEDRKPVQISRERVNVPWE